MSVLTRLIEAFKAWRRGDIRLAPAGVRGRVYARRADSDIVAKSKLVATMSTRVWRESEKAWYRKNANGDWEKE